MKRVVVAAVALFSVVGSALAAENVSANLTAAYLDADAVSKKLAENGLRVLGTHQVAGNKDYTVVIYTAPELLNAARLEGRGFIADLRVLVDSKAKQLVVSNPEYFMRAFLQGDYKSEMAAPVKKALEAALGKLTAGSDALTAKELKKYHFMVGMPHYDDFVRVGKGETADLLKKLEANAKGRVVFRQNIKEDGSVVLCGVALPAKIEKFNEKLGTMGKSQLLPYCVLIGNGEARILHAKFYLALSFPTLTMGQFMKIRSIPGEIKDDFKKCFE